MQSEIKTITYPDGRIQRYQAVRWAGWQQLDFLWPEALVSLTEDADWFQAEEAALCKTLESFERIYRKFLIPGCPWIRNLR